jgi:hypothetical protein
MATTGAAQPPEDSTMEEFFKNVSAKDRTGVEKHLAVIDADPDAAHGRIWRRVAKMLRRLAPLALQTAGQHAIQFFVADGKYRMQVFALEDKKDGTIQLVLPDVLAAALKAGVLAKPPAGHPNDYPIKSAKSEALHVESLDSTNTPDPQPAIKHMLGWNRKALRLTLPSIVNGPQLAAAEALCDVAAKAWTKKEKSE